MSKEVVGISQRAFAAGLIAVLLASLLLSYAISSTVIQPQGETGPQGPQGEQGTLACLKLRVLGDVVKQLKAYGSISLAFSLV